MELKIKKTHPNAILPRKATEGSAGLDLFTALDEPIVILPGEIATVSMGIAIELPSKDMVALVIARSSLAFKYSVSLANSVGVIDSDYRGTINLILQNNSKVPFTVKNGDRLAQLIIVSYVPLNISEVTELSFTERNIGGFGSTDKENIM